MAVQHFDGMERMGLLSADLLNRTGDAFLKQESFGGAIEMLLRSLEVNPQQEVLLPMLDILRTKRPRLRIWSARDDDPTRTVYEYANKRFLTELHVGKPIEAFRSIAEPGSMVWLEGCDERVVALSRMPKICPLILRLRPGDAMQSWLDQIQWEQINTVIVTGLGTEYETFLERVEGIEKRTRVAHIPDGVDCREYGFVCKQRGKNLAYIGPLTAEANPMLLLHCMQKLNYLDPVYRLYLAATGSDQQTESYLRHMSEQMRLSGVVVLDPMPRNLNSWLRDKHYIVAAGIQGQGWDGVLKGMAAGLRPVVANYPGVDERLDREFVFDLAEDFCRQVQSGSYEPQRYREWVESRYSQRAVFRAWNDELYRWEKSLDKGKQQSSPQDMAPPLLTTEHRTSSLTAGSIQAPVTTDFQPIPGGPAVAPFQMEIPPSAKLNVPPHVEVPSLYPLSGFGGGPSGSSGGSCVHPPSEVIPITPLQPVNLNQSPEVLREPGPNFHFDPVPPMSPSQPAHVAVRKQRSVDELAKEALKASQALAELAKQKPPISNPPSEIPESIRSGTVGGNPFGLFQETARESQLVRAASEFHDRPLTLDVPGLGNGEPTAPFYRPQGQ